MASCDAMRSASTCYRMRRTTPSPTVSSANIIPREYLHSKAIHIWVSKSLPCLAADACFENRQIRRT